jgi:hypothetical protein
MSNPRHSNATIEDVVTIDASGRMLADVTVTAGGDTDAPIGIVVDGGSRLALTVAQVDELIRLLTAAKRDVCGGSDTGDGEEQDDG